MYHGTLLMGLAILSVNRAFQLGPLPLARARKRPTFHHRRLWASSAPEEETDDSTTVISKTSTLEEQGVVELETTVSDAKSPNNPSRLVPTFQSQGEIDPETLNVDLSDPKQARVILYIILSLIPVLFLIPLMLGSRDLIPLDSLPPVVLK